jgi:ribose transport system permease protein
VIKPRRREGFMKSQNASIENQVSFLEVSKKYFPYAFLVVMFVTFTLLNPSFVNPGNLINILEQSTVILTMGMGATFVIISGSIDLSVGSIVGLSATLMSMTAAKLGYFSIILGILAGIICGILNGLIYSKTKIPSFIATLGMRESIRGIMYIIAAGRVTLLTGPVRILGTNRLIPFVPNIFLGFLVVFAACYLLFNYTPFGRNARAIGGNEEVSMLSGINLIKTKMLVYTLGGLTCGIAGAFAGIRLGAASPVLGSGYELDVIAAIVLGGTPQSGGVGKLTGTIIGGLIMGILANGMNMAGINSYYQQFIRGIVVIVAVIVTIDRKNSKFVK